LIPVIAVIFVVATSLWFPVTLISGYEDVPLQNVPITNYTVKMTVSGLSTQSRYLKILFQFTDFLALNGSLRIWGRAQVFDSRSFLTLFALDFTEVPEKRATKPLLLYRSNCIVSDKLTTNLLLEYSSKPTIGALRVLWEMEDPRVSYFSSAIRLTYSLILLAALAAHLRSEAKQRSCVDLSQSLTAALTVLTIVSVNPFHGVLLLKPMPAFVCVSIIANDLFVAYFFFYTLVLFWDLTSNWSSLLMPLLASFTALFFLVKDDLMWHSSNRPREILSLQQLETDRQFGQIHQTVVVLYGLVFFLNILLKTLRVSNHQKQRFKFYAVATTLAVPAFVLYSIRDWFMTTGMSIFPEVLNLSVFVLFALAMEYGHLRVASIEEEYYLPAFDLEDDSDSGELNDNVEEEEASD
jgi:hypothetical protein